jgi:hypothetical protein
MFYVLPPKEITTLQNKKRDDFVHSQKSDFATCALFLLPGAILRKHSEVDKPSAGVNSAYERCHVRMGVSSSEASLCTTMVDAGRGKSYTRKAASCVQRAVRAIRGPST